MSESMALVGLDVHQSQTVGAVLDPLTGELRVERSRGEPDRVVPVFSSAPVVAECCKPRPAPPRLSSLYRFNSGT